jgi:hypothetical protein
MNARGVDVVGRYGEGGGCRAGMAIMFVGVEYSGIDVVDVVIG